MENARVFIKAAFDQDGGNMAQNNPGLHEIMSHLASLIPNPQIPAAANQVPPAIHVRVPVIAAPQ